MIDSRKVWSRGKALSCTTFDDGKNRQARGERKP
jgi:hypothetical protein